MEGNGGKGNTNHLDRLGGGLGGFGPVVWWVVGAWVCEGSGVADRPGQGPSLRLTTTNGETRNFGF